MSDPNLRNSEFDVLHHSRSSNKGSATTSHAISRSGAFPVGWRPSHHKTLPMSTSHGTSSADNYAGAHAHPPTCPNNRPATPLDSRELSANRKKRFGEFENLSVASLGGGSDSPANCRWSRGTAAATTTPSSAFNTATATTLHRPRAAGAMRHHHKPTSKMSPEGNSHDTRQSEDDLRRMPEAARMLTPAEQHFLMTKFVDGVAADDKPVVRPPSSRDVRRDRSAVTMARPLAHHSAGASTAGRAVRAPSASNGTAPQRSKVPVGTGAAGVMPPAVPPPPPPPRIDTLTALPSAAAAAAALSPAQLDSVVSPLSLRSFSSQERPLPSRGRLSQGGGRDVWGGGGGPLTAAIHAAATSLTSSSLCPTSPSRLPPLLPQSPLGAPPISSSMESHRSKSEQQLQWDYSYGSREMIRQLLNPRDMSPFSPIASSSGLSLRDMNEILPPRDQDVAAASSSGAGDSPIHDQLRVGSLSDIPTDQFIGILDEIRHTLSPKLSGMVPISCNAAPPFSAPCLSGREGGANHFTTSAYANDWPPASVAQEIQTAFRDVCNSSAPKDERRSHGPLGSRHEQLSSPVLPPPLSGSLEGCVGRYDTAAHIGVPPRSAPNVPSDKFTDLWNGDNEEDEEEIHGILRWIEFWNGTSDGGIDCLHRRARLQSSTQ